MIHASGQRIGAAYIGFSLLSGVLIIKS